MHYIKYLPIFLLLIIISCNSENELPGSAPVADAGPDMEEPVCIGTIILDGSNSSDPDGDTLNYTWTLKSIPDGSTATLNNSNEARASITPDVAGEYVITLSVSDGVHNPVTDEVTLNITADTGNPPVAAAGDDRTVGVNETVTLDGSNSSDPDGDELTYHWTISSTPVGSQATITNADQAQAQFVPDQAGNYVFRLRVTDAVGSCVSEDTDNLIITAE